MKGKVLVTDSLFIFDEHVKQIEDEGYGVERLDVPCATEDQLCQAIQGKVGYILGGVEEVTENVIEAADKLKAIAFTGAGYSEFIPAYKQAKQKGISIAAAIGANADAVSELAITYSLMATRCVPALTSPNGDTFKTTKGVSESVIGIIGYGNIGKKVAEKADKLGYSVLISARNKIENLPSSYRQVDIQTLCREADIVSVHVDKLNGKQVLDSEYISLLKDGSSIVNVAFSEAINVEAALNRAYASELKLFLDQKVEFETEKMPTGYITQTNSQSGFNTFGALKSVSDQTTRSLLNLLEQGEDQFRVV